MGIETNKQRNNPEINQSWKNVSPTGFEPASTAPLGRVKKSVLAHIPSATETTVDSSSVYLHSSNFNKFRSLTDKLTTTNTKTRTTENPTSCQYEIILLLEQGNHYFTITDYTDDTNRKVRSGEERY